MRNKQTKGYHKLLVWQKMKDLLLLTYKLTKKLPDGEKFGLISQMRRAVVSVISNFIEGYLKNSQKDKLRFLEISQTSLMELEAQSEVCRILGYWTESEYELFDNKRGEVAFLIFRYASAIK